MVAPTDKVIELLAIESSKSVNMGAGISTVSFFTTDDIQAVTTYLKQRLLQVLQANPWIAGRLVREKNGSRVQLHYPEIINETHVASLFNESVEMNINSSMPFPDICKTITKNKRAAVPSGSSLINKNKPLMKFSIVPITGNQFALIFSLSHTVADGSTFYRIQNMLCANEEIVSLNVVRHQHYSMEAAVGKTDNAFVFYKSFTLNIIKNLIFGSKSKYFAYYINEAAIKVTKEESRQRGEVSYISTNDIIMSSFMRTIKARLGMMVINFRNRFTDVESNDAGNYEGVKLYDAEVYNTPEGIRKSLQTPIPYKTRENEIPGAWQRTQMCLGQVNNWASFAGDFAIPQCNLVLHLPVTPSTIPFDIAVLFRPVPNRTAILILSKKHDKSFYTNNPDNPLSQYLAEPVSSTVFPA